MVRGYALGAQPVHGRQENLTMQRLHGPAPFNESRCQVIQQLRVAGTIAHEPKIARGPHDSSTKMMMPDAIDDHARG